MLSLLLSNAGVPPVGSVAIPSHMQSDIGIRGIRAAATSNPIIRHKAIQTSFAKKVARFQNTYDCFLAPLGNDGELDLALLDVKSRVRLAALRKNNLVLVILGYCSPIPTLARNVFGSNAAFLLFFTKKSSSPDEARIKSGTVQQRFYRYNTEAIRCRRWCVSLHDRRAEQGPALSAAAPSAFATSSNAAMMLFLSGLAHSISYSFPSQRLCDRLRQENCKVGTSPSLQIANRALYEGSCEHHRVTVRLNKDAVRSGDYLVSPLVKA